MSDFFTEIGEKLEKKTGESWLLTAKNLTVEDLLEIDGIGPEIAESWVKYFATHEKTLINLAKEINPMFPKKSGAVQDLKNEIICITGSFDESRDVIAGRLRVRGAKVTTGVTKNTTILLAGEKSGSKLEKAEKFGVKICKSESEI